MENKIFTARQQIDGNYKDVVCFKTEVLKDVRQVQATIYLQHTNGEYIISTGYSFYGNTHSDIPAAAKRATIDAINNYNPSLIK